MTDRDRLAADLHEIACGASARAEWDLCVRDHRHEADRLIALGWTRKDSKDLTVDEERLARALVATGFLGDAQAASHIYASQIAKAYREDAG